MIYFFYVSVHLKKVYMVSDESMLPITFYNRPSHMLDMPWKLTLKESLIGYLAKPITRVSMPSLHGWFQVAGSPLHSMIPLPPEIKKPVHPGPAIYTNCAFPSL